MEAILNIALRQRIWGCIAQGARVKTNICLIKIAIKWLLVTLCYTHGMGYAQTSSERLPPALVGNIVKRQEPTARLYAEWQC